MSIMKKFISIIALVAAMFSINTPVSNAQTHWGDINHTIKKTHTLDYIKSGDDAYRMGNYKEAMEAYKNAREYNEHRGYNIVPPRDIERKMDRCAEAMRRENRGYSGRHESVSGTTAAVAGAAILGGIIAAAVSDNSNHNNSRSAAPAVSNNNGGLRDMSHNGITYSTAAANNNCYILSVKSDLDYTVVEMEYIAQGKNTTIMLDKDTYIKDRFTGNKLYLRDVQGISTKVNTAVSADDSHVFRLYFDRINSNCSEIDLIEPGTSSWKFYHVSVK